MPSAKKVVLLLSARVVSSFVLVVAYKAVENIRYYNWKSKADSLGYFGKIAIASSNSQLLWEYKAYGDNGNIKTNRYGFRDRDYTSTDI